MRRLTLGAVVATAAVAGVLPAAAKEGVKATLLTHIPQNAQPGSRLEVAWRLFSTGDKGRPEPFNAMAVFVRLDSATGAVSREAFARGDAHPTGAYAATVVVPKGGIGDIEIGLMGWSDGPNGSHRSDAMFPITNDPGSEIGRSGSGPSFMTWALLGGGLAVLTAALVAAALRRTRRGSASPIASS